MIPMPARHGGRAPAARTWLWVAGMVASVAALIAVYEVFVTTSTGQRADHVALEAATERFEELQGLALIGLTRLPEITAAVAVVVFAVVTVWRRRWLASLIAVGAFTAANLSTQVLKNVLLDRPDLDNGVPYLTGNSLPSGHTTFATAAAMAAFLVVAPRWRPATAALGAAFATTVGSGTFVEAWHRPADVVAAYLVVAFWGLVGGLFVLRTGAAWNTRRPRAGQTGGLAASPWWDAVLWLGGLLATAGALAAYRLAGGVAALVAEPPQVSAWHFVGGLAFTIGPGLLVFAALATLFRLEAGREHGPPTRP